MNANEKTYSTIKREHTRPDLLSSMTKIQINLKYVLGFTSKSNRLIDQNCSVVAYAAGSTVILYDVNKQQQDFIINTSTKTLTSLSLSRNSRYLAAGESGHDPKVRLWDLTGNRTVCIELRGHAFSIDSLCFSPGSDRLVSIGSIHDGNIYVWDLITKRQIASSKCLCSINRTAFSDDGKYFVTVGKRHVRFWYFKTILSKETVPLDGHYAILGENRDKNFIDVVCGRDHYAQMAYTITLNGIICQFDEQRKIKCQQNLKKKLNCLAVNNLYIAIGCARGVVEILSPGSLEHIMSLPRPHYLGIDCQLSISADQMTQPNISFPNTVAICLDNEKSNITCFYDDHSFYIWDMEKENSVKRCSHMFHSGCVQAIETCYKQLELCITCSSDNTIRFWAVNRNDQTTDLEKTSLFKGELMKIIYLDNDCSKLNNQQINQEDAGCISKVGGLCMKTSPDGCSLAVGNQNGSIRIINLQTFVQDATIKAHDTEVLSIDFCESPNLNTTFLASSGRDHFVHIFDASNNYKWIATLNESTASVIAVRFAPCSIPSNLQLILCNADKSLIFVLISKNEDGKYEFTRSRNIFKNQTFHDIKIDYARKVLYAACQDRMIRVYNTETGECIQQFNGAVNVTSGHLLKIDIDTTGRYIAASCSNKYVYILDTGTQRCIASLCGHSQMVTDVKFSRDGQYIYTSCGDSCIFIWDIAGLTNLPIIHQSQRESTASAKANETFLQSENVVKENELESICEESSSSYKSEIIEIQLNERDNVDDKNSSTFSGESVSADDSRDDFKTPDYPMPKDSRMQTVDCLIDGLQKYLNEINKHYEAVSYSSDTNDAQIKKYIEQQLGALLFLNMTNYKSPKISLS